MPFFIDIPDLVEPTSARADGPLPTLVKCTDINHQVALALKAARQVSATQSVAILVKKALRKFSWKHLQLSTVKKDGGSIALEGAVTACI